jgi:hypothetical protein
MNRSTEAVFGAANPESPKFYTGRHRAPARFRLGITRFRAHRAADLAWSPQSTGNAVS